MLPPRLVSTSVNAQALALTLMYGPVQRSTANSLPQKGSSSGYNFFEKYSTTYNPNPIPNHPRDAVEERASPSSTVKSAHRTPAGILGAQSSRDSTARPITLTLTFHHATRSYRCLKIPHLYSLLYTTFFEKCMNIILPSAMVSDMFHGGRR